MKFKYVAYGAIFLLVGSLLVQTYRLSVRNTELNRANENYSLLEERLKIKKDSINILESENVILQNKSDSLTRVVRELKASNKELLTKLDDALAEIDYIPAEENYIYLKDVAYNYPGDLIYPFNSKQVSEIRKDYTENNLLKKVNVNLNNAIGTLKKQIDVKDELILNRDARIDIYKGMIDSYKIELEDVEKDVAILNKEVIKQKNVKHLFQGATVVSTVLLILSIL